MPIRRHARQVVPAVALILMLSALVAAQDARRREQTSENNPKLKHELERFPEADKNKDGILTLQEARKFREAATGGETGQQGAKGAAAVKPTFADVRYGEHPRNVMDFWRAKSEKPAPVLICIHGGGFRAGDKSKFASSIPGWLKEGISVVAINYRFVDGPNSEPFPGPMLDGARAIQFVRTKAAEWNIDPKRIALTGGSAGGCMSVWLALHDDMADPKSDDPVKRESTRVSCVIGQGAQTCLDPKIMFAKIGGNPAMHPMLLPFYGAKTMEDLEKPEFRKLIEEASATNFASADDPPLMLCYKGRIDNVPLPPDASTGVSIHHAMFGKVMQEKLEPLGVECGVYYEGNPATPEMQMAFLKKHLGLERQ
ncbi:MAG TPA: alpha/beta hydrolase [Candidatus Brocadiia bacterium]|nr:alpha/beta hydrolase [Candidatus Brocadiia bacterium]